MSVTTTEPVAGVDPATTPDQKSTIYPSDAVALLLIFIGACTTSVSLGEHFGIWSGLCAAGGFMFVVGIMLAIGSGS